jgi:hypothetical protein
MPLSIEKDVAPVDEYVSSEGDPPLIGFVPNESVQVRGAFTVSVALHVPVPPVPLTVPVYVVVTPGAIEVGPPESPTAPIPLILIDVASAEDQVSVLDCVPVTGFVPSEIEHVGAVAQEI